MSFASLIWSTLPFCVAYVTRWYLPSESENWIPPFSTSLALTACFITPFGAPGPGYISTVAPLKCTNPFEYQSRLSLSVVPMTVRVSAPVADDLVMSAAYASIVPPVSQMSPMK